MFATSSARRARRPLARYEIDRAELVAASTDQRRAWGFFDLVFAEAGIDLDDRTAAAIDELQAYHCKENLWEISPDYAKPVLQRLRDDGYRLVVVSNANGKLHHLRVEKPDRRFFELALARSGGRADSTVHVGDLYHVDVAGARNAGLRKDADCPRVRTIAELPELLRR